MLRYEEEGDSDKDLENEKGRPPMVQNNLESSLKYWATRLSIRSFVSTAHSFAHSVLLALLMQSAMLIRLLVRSLNQSKLVGQ